MIDNVPKVFNNISESLGADFKPSEVKTEIIKKEESVVDAKVDTDFEYARRNLRELIEKGKASLDNAISLADSLDQPRGFEVVSAFAKQLAEMNKDLLDLHQQKKNINKENITVNNKTTNAIYVGSTSDLQDIVNQSRSRKKALDNGEQG